MSFYCRQNPDKPCGIQRGVGRVPSLRSPDNSKARPLERSSKMRVQSRGLGEMCREEKAFELDFEEQLEH